MINDQNAGGPQCKNEVPNCWCSSASLGRPIILIQKKMVDQLLYTLPQEKKRILLPKIASFLLLGLVFYLGVLLNLYLLNLQSATAALVKIISIVIICIIILIGVMMDIKKAKQNYLFYSNKIIFGKGQILLSQITEIRPERSYLDKLFKAYSISLNSSFVLKNIPQEIQLQDYIQKLVNYAKSQSY
ncbi:MAG: hypothetical protein ABIA37_03700 [Candidatus Woesearchaeota archaeon]